MLDLFRTSVSLGQGVTFYTLSCLSVCFFFVWLILYIFFCLSDFTLVCFILYLPITLLIWAVCPCLDSLEYKISIFDTTSCDLNFTGNVLLLLDNLILILSYTFNFRQIVVFSLRGYIFLQSVIFLISPNAHSKYLNSI